MERFEFQGAGGVVAILCLTLLATGCGRGNVPQPRAIPVVPDPVGDLRTYLEGYAEGESVSSESEIFPQLVEAVREVNPEIAGWLGETLAEIDAKPATRRSLAKKALARLDEEAPPPAPGSSTQP
jgi:hypothetical protein